MARTQLTARKSTGGMAPRRKLILKDNNDSESSGSDDESSDTDANAWRQSHQSVTDLDVSTLMQYTDLSTAATRLPTNVMSSNMPPLDEPTSISSMPIFNLGTIDDGSYILSRKTTQLKDSVSTHGNKFLASIIKRSKKKYPNSDWVMVWENEEGNGFSILAEEMCDDGEYEELSDILESGELHGCDLRGNMSTNQFGLVSDIDLPARTFVAVECGVVWSECIHDDVIKEQGDPLLGLTSNLIPARLLQQLSDGRSWKSYRKGCKQAKEARLNRLPGFVVESSFRGNETKHIDDPQGLSLAGGGVTEKETPNLEARAILDLKHSSITVGFETNRNVLEGTELTMNWGCWGSICDQILPGHAQMSLVAYKREQALKDITQSKITPDIRQVKVEFQETTSSAVYYNPKKSVFCCLEELDMELGDGITEHLGKEFSLLSDIMKGSVSATAGLSTKGCRPFDYDKEVYKMFAEASQDAMSLSQTTINKMKRIPRRANTNFGRVKQKIHETFDTNVEVVEILDMNNPAKLFELPGREALGLRAKQAIRKGTPILAYGGIIEQNGDGETSNEGYVMDCTMPEEYKGPGIYIDGRRSLGGMINDPWTPSGYPKRESNMIPIEHWDEETKTPQIILYSTRNIKKGDELLYSYGENYWKVTWLTLMREHAESAAASATKCRLYRERILEFTNLTEEELEKEIVEAMQRMDVNEEGTSSEEESSEEEEEEEEYRLAKSGYVYLEEDALKGRSLRSGQKF